MRPGILCLACIIICGMLAMPTMPVVAAETEGNEATLIIYRPKRFQSGAVRSSYRVNDQHVGKFKSGYVKLTVNPGIHEARNFFPASREEKYLEQTGKWHFYSKTLELSVEPGSVNYVHQGRQGILELVTAQVATAELAKLHDLTTDTVRVVGNFVTPTEERAWSHCEETKSVEDCGHYHERYPYGVYAEQATSLLAAASTPATATISERQRTLPIEVQRDRCMLLLTSALKEERYSDALVYFNELEALGGDRPPSFMFYHGETLFHVGQSEQAIDKLYEYIALAGPEGEHYQRALELSNEAEE